MSDEHQKPLYGLLRSATNYPCRLFFFLRYLFFLVLGHLYITLALHLTFVPGPIPTATTAPGSTSSQREPMSSLEIYSPLEPIILTTTNIPVPTPSEVQTRNGNAIIL